MNTESTITEICDTKKYEELLMKESVQSAEKLNEHYYMVNYTTNSDSVEEADLQAPTISEVHLAAAIRACARIHMYPYVARADSYYTDTDSIEIGQPLPDELVSSTELGLFKLTYRVKKGIFFAPKNYMLEISGGGILLKHTGPAKETADWFKRLLADPSITTEMSKDFHFRIDLEKVIIGRQNMNITLGQPHSTTRENVYDANGDWVGTRSRNVIDLGSQDANTIFSYELKKRNK